MKNSEEVILFYSSIEAMKFTNKAVEAATGNNLSSRDAHKVRGAIDVVDAALGINTVDTVVSAFENGIGGTASKILGGSLRKTGKLGAVLGAVAGVESGKPETVALPQDKSLSYDDQIDAIKKFKELLDAGIISQEEFDRKKYEIMG